MFLYSLLEVSEQTTNAVKWISIIGVVLVLAVIALIGFLKNGKKWDAKKIAFAGICVSMSFTLAVIKFSPVQYGGSVTVASFVPILIFAYVYGVADGLSVVFIHLLVASLKDLLECSTVDFLRLRACPRPFGLRQINWMR